MGNQNGESVLVLVVTHKEFDCSVVPRGGYKVIKVGNKLPSERARELGFLTDDTGVNISNENPYYCELTAQYWAWKNIDPDTKIIGIVHYRRYFFDYSRKTNRWSDHIVSVERIKSLLDNHQVIMSFPSVKKTGFSMLYKNKPDEKQDRHWVIIRDIVKNSYPEMYSTFERIIYGRKTIYGNMMIAKRAVFDGYCEWIFDVLNQYDDYIKKSGEDRLSRIDGYLSEPLLLVWIEYNLKKKDIYYLEVRNTETDSFLDYNSNLIGLIMRVVRHCRLFMLVLQKIKMFILYIVRH